MNKISDTRPDIRYGIFAGVGVVLFFSVLWLSFPRAAFGTFSLYFSLLIYFICMFLAVIESHKKTEGGLAFRQAAQKAFVVYLIANVFYWLYYWLMHSLNPEIATYQKTDALETAKHFFPKRELAKRLVSIQESDFSVSFWHAVQHYFTGVFGAFFSSLFIAFVHWLIHRER